MLKPHLSYIAAISVHRRTSGYPWRGGSVRSNFQCRLLYLKTYGGSREVVEDGRSLLNSWRWSLGWYKWGVKCTDPNSRTSVFWTTLTYTTLTSINQPWPTLTWINPLRPTLSPDLHILYISEIWQWWNWGPLSSTGGGGQTSLRIFHPPSQLGHRRRSSPAVIAGSHRQ